MKKRSYHVHPPPTLPHTHTLPTPTLHTPTQDADLLYLTGITQPALALVGDAATHDGLFLLFLPENRPERELWDGARMTPDAAVGLFDADDAYTIDEVWCCVTICCCRWCCC